MYMYGHQLLKQKIGYDKAAAVAKKAHKEGTTLKVRIVHKRRLTFWTLDYCCMCTLLLLSSLLLFMNRAICFLKRPVGREGTYLTALIAKFMFDARAWTSHEVTHPSTAPFRAHLAVLLCFSPKKL